MKNLVQVPVPPNSKLSEHPNIDKKGGIYTWKFWQYQILCVTWIIASSCHYILIKSMKSFSLVNLYILTFYGHALQIQKLIIKNSWFSSMNLAFLPIQQTCFLFIHVIAIMFTRMDSSSLIKMDLIYKRIKYLQIAGYETHTHMCYFNLK